MNRQPPQLPPRCPSHCRLCSCSSYLRSHIPTVSTPCYGPLLWNAVPPAQAAVTLTPPTSAPAPVITARSQLSTVTVPAPRPAIDGVTAPALHCIKTDQHAAKNAVLAAAITGPVAAAAATGPGPAATAVITATLPSTVTAALAMDPATAPNHHATGHEVDNPATPAQPAAGTAPIAVITVAATPAATSIAETTAARAPVLGLAVLVAAHCINPARPSMH